MVDRKVRTVRGSVRSVALNISNEGNLELAISLKGKNGSGDTRVICVVRDFITVQLSRSSEYIIEITELTDTGWEDQSFYVKVYTETDFDFYASSVRIHAGAP